MSVTDTSLARAAFRADWAHLAVVEIDALLAEEAARLADLTGTRSLDAIHLAAIQRAGPLGITLVTADLRPSDLRRAQAARPWARRPSASELEHHVLSGPNHSWY